MVEAAESIATFVAGRTRSNLVIGEAASQISDETRSRAEDVPWRAMVGMRNRIVHAYFDIDADIVWKTAVEEVPGLLPRLRELLEQAKKGGTS
jgi:uncharacterized protein with HEPN domain